MKRCLIFLLIFPLNLFASNSCGYLGSVEDRIKNCKTHTGLFDLVFRSEEGVEVWRDSKTGLLWGDQLHQKMTHFNAMSACQTELTSLGGIKGDWRLPTSLEFRELGSNGAKEVLPNTSGWFWSSKVHIDFKAYAWVFSPYYNRGFFGHRVSDGAVRCVLAMSY